MLAILLTVLPAMATNFGTNGTSCDHATLQDAIDAAPALGTVYARIGTHSISTALVGKSITIESGDTSCAPSTSSFSILEYSAPSLPIRVSAGNALELERIYISGGDNDVTNEGGGLYMGSASSVTLRDSRIANSTATRGGGIFMEPDSALTVISDELGWLTGVTDNEAGFGAGIYARAGSTITLGAGARINRNVALQGGGGVWCYDCSIVGIGTSDDRIEFNDNVGSVWTLPPGGHGEGGAIRMDGEVPSVSLLYAEFVGNHSSSGGGTVQVYDGTLTLLDVNVRDNTSDAIEGNFALHNAEMTWIGGVAQGNQGEVGAVIDNSGADVYISQVELRENTVIGQGAVIYQQSGTSEVRNSLLVDSQSAGSGLNAGIYASGGTMEVLDVTVANNPQWGVVFDSASAGYLRGSIVWDNPSDVLVHSGIAFQCNDTGNGATSGSNISANPDFTDAPNGDYTLSGSSSPAWDGCPAHTSVSLNGVDRSVGASDMGAYDH